MRTATLLALVLPVVATLFPRPLAAQGGTEIWMADIVNRSGQVHFANVRRVTDRPGYDNQPRFTANGRSILYTSNRGGQTDIWRYDIARGTHTAVTSTPESEYSPTEAPPGPLAGRLVVVRVEADSTQRLWSFRPDGTDFRVVVQDLRGVGYYQWFPESQMITFMVGDPPELEIVDLATGNRHVITQNIGSTFQVVPEHPSVLYVARDGEATQLIAWSPVNPNQPLALGALPGAPHFAYDAAHGRVFAPREGTIMVLETNSPERGYQPVRGLETVALTGITRLALNADGSRIAFVVAEGS